MQIVISKKELYMKIIADKNIPYLKGIVEKYGSTTYLSGSEFNKETIKDADTLIVRTVAQLGKEVLEGSKVKLICSATIGFDHIDIDYCKANNITWTNAPGCNSTSVQQYIASTLINLSTEKCFDLNKMTIGIVGVGNVGKKVAHLCQVLGMKVLLNDPPREKEEGGDIFVSLGQIKKEADIITFHTPLDKVGEYKTYHLADKSFFENLDKKPFIINAARGGIIDTNAIIEAMQSKKIQGAIIDCWENEPNIDLTYLGLVNIASPHIAGYSADGKANATRMSLDSLAKFWKLDPKIAKLVKPKEIDNNIIDLSMFANDKWSRLCGSLLHTYDSMEDDKNIRREPQLFKKLRNEYRVRRENSAYTIINYNNEEEKIYKSLGFNLKN